MIRTLALFKKKLWRFGYGALGSTYSQGADGVEVELPHPGVAGKVYTTTEDGIEWAEPGASGGHYEPFVDNSDPDNPSLVYLGDGDVLMLWVED